MESQQSERFENWCVVEVFGHQTYAGYVTERTIGGAAINFVIRPLRARFLCGERTAELHQDIMVLR